MGMLEDYPALAERVEETRNLMFARLMALYCWTLDCGSEGTTALEAVPSVQMARHESVTRLFWALEAEGLVYGERAQTKWTRWYAVRTEDLQDCGEDVISTANDADDDYDYPVRRLVPFGEWTVGRADLAPNSVFAWARPA